jgi:CelD/BcsL family acetyltransferase involved in cellulose biosynthesis
MAILEAGRLIGRTSYAAPGFRIDFVDDWKVAAARWRSVGQGTAFQHPLWLEAWYGAFADTTPLIAIVTDNVTERQIALVPLIVRVSRGVRIVEFADLNVTDYNAPILGVGAALDATESRAMCQALVAAVRRLPGGADLIRLRKMPVNLDGGPNPLAVLGRAGSSSLNGNLIVTGDDFEAYRNSIKRMQLPRSWRVFNRHPGAAFRMVSSVDEASKIMDVMDAQQQARMQKLGLEFVLNDTRHAEFYRDLVRRGLSQGYAVVSALTCDEAVIATVLGLKQGDSFVFLRISNGGRQWANCSPSRLIIERTMAALHAQGVRRFDLSIGNYPFKRRFGAAQLRLVDASIALTWRGNPYAWRDYAAQALRRHPRLAAAVNRLLRGRYPGEDE